MKDGRDWPIHRNKRGWLRWYQRWVEAWLIITGKWSLHRAWQEGLDHGSRMEWQRVCNGGDMLTLPKIWADLRDRNIRSASSSTGMKIEHSAAEPKAPTRRT